MTPANHRHFRRMLICIRAVKSGATPLLPGADSLLFLRNALENVGDAWDAGFTAHLATLESAGLATAQQITAMGIAYEITITGALDALENLVLSQFPPEAPFNESDDDELT